MQAGSIRRRRCRYTHSVYQRQEEINERQRKIKRLDMHRGAPLNHYDLFLISSLSQVVLIIN
jgi:hypothetical protein